MKQFPTNRKRRNLTCGNFRPIGIGRSLTSAISDQQEIKKPCKFSCCNLFHFLFGICIFLIRDYTVLKTLTFWPLFISPTNNKTNLVSTKRQLITQKAERSLYICKGTTINLDLVTGLFRNFADECSSLTSSLTDILSSINAFRTFFRGCLLHCSVSFYLFLHTFQKIVLIYLELDCLDRPSMVQQSLEYAHCTVHNAHSEMLA